MNHKTLKHIARSAELLDAGTVQDLIELTKRFPYFAWPFALLARHYHQKQDFRTEALMHQAAMRVHDRTWLFGFTHDSKSPENQDASSLSSLDSKSTKNTHSKLIENTESPNEKSTKAELNPPAIANPTPALEAPLHKEIPPVKPAEANTHATNNKVLHPPLDTEKVEEPVAIPQEPIAIRQEPIDKPQEPIAKPQEPIAIPQEPVKIPEVATTPAKPEEKSFAKIATKTEPKPEPKKSKPQFTPETVAYDLERIFSFTEPEKTPEHQGNASNDFYSWLNGKQKKAQPEKTPPIKPAAEIPQSVEHQKSIIENFLLTKPSISRPKQEFFKPEKAQKKGEKLTGAIVTETLARIYLKQDNPQKAIWAYEQLQLKFPEKKTYFANLISQIEKEQNKS